MAKGLKGKGKIVVLKVISCVINGERVDAFNEVIKEYQGVETLDSQAAQHTDQLRRVWR